jgi:pimeloyl-ACP methyl ester carboxylesterase
MLRTDEGQEMIDLLPTGLWEIREFRRLEQLDLTYERYRDIRAETLLLGGSKSPSYLLDAIRVLAQTMPCARLVEFPGLDHVAPNQNAPETFAVELKRFFGAGYPTDDYARTKRCSGQQPY